MLRSFYHLFTHDPVRRWLLIEAMVSLTVARLAVLLVPFPRIAKRLGTFLPPAKAAEIAATRPLSPSDMQMARLVGWSIKRGVAHLPFACVCLPQAMAAQAMLRRRGIASAMHFGAALNRAKPIDAHAWLDADGVKVTGYPLDPAIAEIGCFV